MKKLSILSVGALGALALMGLGCNPAAKVQEGVVENIINKQTGGQANVDLSDNGGVTFKDAKTGDYSAFGVNAKIPDGFPTDIPQYAGAKTVSVTLKGDGKEASITQTTTDGAEKVATALEAAIKDKGFTVAGTISAGAAKIVSFEKGNVKIVISVASNTGGDVATTITVTRTEE